MTGWTPLFQQIVASSIWSAPDHVRIAWVTLLAITPRDGVAPITAGGLARMANITREQAEDALNVLSSPDEDTLTQKNEGRRIERVAGGWKLLNWHDYRDKAKAAMVREQNREAQARWRESQEEEKSDTSTPGKTVKPPTLEEVKLQAAKIGISDAEAEKFLNYWEARKWEGKNGKIKSWTHAMTTWKTNLNKFSTTKPAQTYTQQNPNLPAQWGDAPTI